MKLILEGFHVQVYNFHSTFSEAVICDEDKPTMQAGNWNLTSADGMPCLRMNGAIAFNITYQKQEGNATALINLPPDAVVMPSSYCAEKGKDINTTIDQQLDLGFYDNWLLSLHFTRDPNVTHDKRDDHWMVDRVSLSLRYENLHFHHSVKQNRDTLHNDVSEAGEGALGLFYMRNDRSYSCVAMQERMVVPTFIILTESVQVQPFMDHPEFLLPESCAADMMVSDVVPIIIGAALAILIVIVLVAYLIGRARTRRQTYENI